MLARRSFLGLLATLPFMPTALQAKVVPELPPPWGRLRTSLPQAKWRMINQGKPFDQAAANNVIMEDLRFRELTEV